MSSLILVIFTITVTTGLIYFIYKIILGPERLGNDSELQITAKEIIEELNILYKQKKYNIVQSLAKNYLQRKGGNDDVRAILAKSYYETKDFYLAVEEIRKIVKHNPLNFEAQILLANCFLSIEKPMQAIETLQEVLEKDSDNVVAIKLLAEVYFKTNQKKSAILMYKRLNEFLDSNFEKAKNKSIVAEIHIEYLDFGSAINEYKGILEIYPDDIKVKKRLIELYKRLPDFDSLIQLATELSESSQNTDESLFALKSLMDAYCVLHDYQNALDFANLMKNHPLSDPRAIDEEIARILLERGSTEDSIELLKNLVQGDPKNIVIRKKLANAYESKSDYKIASDIYKDILDMAKFNEVEQVHYEISNLYADWANYAFSQNEIEECFKHFSTALTHNDKNSDIYYRLGEINRAIKNFNEAISQFKHAIELNPEKADYYQALGECYGEIDSIYEQKKAFSECLKYNPDNAVVNYKLGVIYSSQNNQDNAIMHIKKAIELDRNFNDAKRKLALVYEHIGKPQEAIDLYEEILASEPENEEIANNLRMLKTQL